MIAIVCSFLWPILFCYFANSVTDRVSAISYTVYDMNWYDQPVKMQKYVILMIARTHERIRFSGLGLIACSIEVFGEVCSSSELFWCLQTIIIDISNRLNRKFFDFHIAASEDGKFILFDFQTLNAALELIKILILRRRKN